MAQSFTILDNSTIVLAGPNRILIKTFCYCFYPGTDVKILKDSFCDFETSVLYVGGQLVDVQQVKNL